MQLSSIRDWGIPERFYSDCLPKGFKRTAYFKLRKRLRDDGYVNVKKKLGRPEQQVEKDQGIWKADIKYKFNPLNSQIWRQWYKT